MESISGLYGKAGDCAYDKVEQHNIPPNSKELSKVFIQSTIYENTQHNPKRTNQHDFKIDAIGFNLAEAFASIDLELNKVDLVCEFQINDWNGGNKLELKIIDLCCSVEKN